jgi:hypothetical protein
VPVVGREMEREIEALLAARTEQIPSWHDVVQRGEHELSVFDHIQLLHHLLGIHAELIVRLAQAIDALDGM